MELLALPYPITPSPLGAFRAVGTEVGIKGDLLQLLLTNPGEKSDDAIFWHASTRINFSTEYCCLARFCKKNDSRFYKKFGSQE